jgi:hypothetical protein
MGFLYSASRFFVDLFEKMLRHLKSGFTTNLASVERLPVFLPVSGHHSRVPELGFQAANNFPSQLLMLVNLLEEIRAPYIAELNRHLATNPANEMEPISIDEFEVS